MLSDKAQLLLSAYVDGALSPQDRGAAERLMRESSDARAFVQKLADNIKRIKALQRRSLGGDFPNQVLFRLSIALPVPVAIPVAPLPSRPVAQTRRLVKKPRLRRGMPTWAVGGIAAAVVGGIVIGGAFWLRSELAVGPELLPRGNVHTPMVESKPVSKNEPSQTTSAPNPIDPLTAQANRSAAKKNVDSVAEPPLAPTSESARFTFADLKKQDKFDSLKWELAHSHGAPGGVRLDVTVRYDARSLSRIIESFHKQGMPLVVTPAAEASVAKNKPLLVYAENVNADQIALALQELSEADIQGKRKVASTFETLRIAPSSVDDHTRIAEGLGIDAKQLNVSAKPMAKAAAVGVVLAEDRPIEPSASGEIQSFIAGRGSAKSGALQIFLRLQPTGK